MFSSSPSLVDLIYHVAEDNPRQRFFFLEQMASQRPKVISTKGKMGNTDAGLLLKKHRMKVVLYCSFQRAIIK
jgi:hypothetical protein